MIFIYTYFAINIFIAGMYFGDVSFKLYNKWEIGSSLFLFLFFGGIILVWQHFFENKFDKFLINTLFGFYWKMYVLNKYDNLSEKQLEYCVNKISTEKELKTDDKQSIKLIKNLTKILKRNENNKNR